MAAAYVEEIQRFQPHGPYCLGGYCLGGSIALEMAGLLRGQGEEVSLVALLDTYNFSEAVAVGRWHDLAERVKFHLGSFVRLRPGQMISYLAEKIRVARDGEFAALFSPGDRGQREVEKVRTTGRVALNRIQSNNDHAVAGYRPRPYPGKITVFKPQKNYAAFPDPKMGWGDIALGGLEVVELPMNPHAMLVEPFVQQLAAALAAAIDQASSGDPTRPLPA